MNTFEELSAPPPNPNYANFLAVCPWPPAGHHMCRWPPGVGPMPPLPPAVPEPGAWAMLLVGVAIVAWRAHRAGWGEK